MDFILNDMEVAIEIKTSKHIHNIDVTALKVLQQEYSVKKAIVVSFESEPKTLDNNIVCLPWENFLLQLWGGELI